MNLRLLALYARSRGLGQAFVALGIVTVAGVIVSPVDQVSVILWRDVSVDTADLIGVLPALLFGPTFARSLGEVELVQRRRGVLLRVMHTLVASVGVLLATAAIVSAIRGESPVAAGGNAVAMLGLLLLTQASGWPIPSWTIPLTVVIAMYFLGLNPSSREPRVWAWLLWPNAGARTAINLSILAVGALLFLVRTPLDPPELDD